MADVILGLDLSLRGAGMVALPLDWGGDWRRIARHTEGESLPRDAREELRIGRLKRIADSVVAFAKTHRCTIVVVEQYAFNQAAQASRIGELGGVVKHQLVEKVGLLSDNFVASTARKLVLGKVPRENVKNAVIHALTRMGMPLEWGNDEADAFVGANWKAAEIGGFAFVVPPPVPEKKRGRKAA